MRYLTDLDSSLPYRAVIRAYRAEIVATKEGLRNTVIANTGPVSLTPYFCEWDEDEDRFVITERNLKGVVKEDTPVLMQFDRDLKANQGFTVVTPDNNVFTGSFPDPYYAWRVRSVAFNASKVIRSLAIHPWNSFDRIGEEAVIQHNVGPDVTIDWSKGGTQVITGWSIQPTDQVDIKFLPPLGPAFLRLVLPKYDIKDPTYHDTLFDVGYSYRSEMGRLNVGEPLILDIVYDGQRYFASRGDGPMGLRWSRNVLPQEGWNSYRGEFHKPDRATIDFIQVGTTGNKAWISHAFTWKAGVTYKFNFTASGYRSAWWGVTMGDQDYTNAASVSTYARPPLIYTPTKDYEGSLKMNSYNSYPLQISGMSLVQSIWG